MSEGLRVWLPGHDKQEPIINRLTDGGGVKKQRNGAQFAQTRS